jgi:hypothetical protein
MALKKKLLLPFLILLTLILCGWGKTGHKIINTNTVLSFPPQMKEFMNWSGPLALHASDADYRKGDDSTEGPKHYIDIDSYPEFVSTGRISEDYDSIVTAHGESFVIDQGILPWAIIAAYDTLEKCFERKDWDKTVLVAADLGHYVADSHQPLHITKNYNPGGLHSRYETGMVDRYQSQIVYSGDSVQFVQNIPDFVFTTIYNNYIYVDSVLNADVQAKAVNSDTKSDAYYQALWNITGSFTIKLFKSASYKLACLIYTAWMNAGSPLPSATDIRSMENSKMTFQLMQNYPNPFNPSTIIKYSIPSARSPLQGGARGGLVTLKVYDMLGREVATLVNENQKAGNYKVKFNGSNLPSGLYFYRIISNNFTATKKMLLMK